jgi:pilus assembly protein CpaB
VSRRRRAALLLGLALTLGGLAASDVAQREAALDRRLGPIESVLVARRAVIEGAALVPSRVAVARLPARFAPPGAFRSPDQLTGLRARAALPAGAYLTPAVVRDPETQGAGLAAGLRPGERMAQVTGAGDASAIGPGSRVDVLVTHDADGAGRGHTEIALKGAEVLAAHPSTAGDGSDAGDPGPQLTVSLRVTLQQAVDLATAQGSSGSVRLLVHA